MTPYRLTYCGNVHAAPDLETVLAAMREHAAPVAAVARARGRSFGLGAWWPMSLAGQLAADRRSFGRLQRTMKELDLPLWTLNVFPHGGFHDAVVKTAVYDPDWGTEERLLYTRTCAEVGAWLVPPGTLLPLSTLPLGYRGPGSSPPDLRLMARNLVRCASAFAAIEDKTGVRCVLAIEPEPDCLLESVAATAHFMETWLFEEGAWATVPEEVLRRHLGVCVDLCHLAVVGEEPIRALRDLQTRRIAVPKIQVSSCLEVRDARGIDRLLQFAEPRYLHQTVAESGVRVLDLEELRRRRADFENSGRIRSHYHVPLYWDESGPFGSTRAEVERVLRTLPQLGWQAPDPPIPLLEVETYTWGVLGDFAGSEPLAVRLAKELDWAASCMES